MAGTYQLLKNGKARLQYMYKGERYSETVEAKNAKEASTKLASFVTDIRSDKISNCNITYLQFAQKWIDDYVRPNLSPTVSQCYIRHLNNRILPYLGRMKLKDITPKVLRNLFNDMKTWKTNYKAPRENKPITKGTYEKFYEIVSGSLQKAFEWEYIVNNPCRKVPIKSFYLDRLPSEIEKRKQNTLQKIRAYDKKTYNNVINMLNSSSNNNIDIEKRICAEFILKTGLCLSEVAGLEWDRDWNKENSTISIRIIQVYIKGQGWVAKEPKEEKRARTITLSNSSNMLLCNLRKLHPHSKFIFFENINFNSYTSWLKTWQLKNNITPILTTHELRHTHATLLLQEGIPVKYISERLGHSSTKITEDTYIEYLQEHNDIVADAIDKI